MGDPILLELHALQNSITVLPGKRNGDTAAAKHHDCNDGDDQGCI